MNNECSGDGPNDEICPARKNRRIWFVGYIKRKFHERRAKKKNESAADRAAKKTATATVWMAIFTVVIATISGGGIWISFKTLKEIQTSGTQTDQTIAALQSQATSLHGQLGQLEASNGTAKETLITNSRAWIGIQGASSVKPTADTDLDVTTLYINTGRQPAMNLTYAVDAFVLPAKSIAEALANITNTQQKCLSGRRENLGVAYPSSGFSTYNLRTTIGKNAITKEVIDRGDVFYVTGCFSYESFEIIRYSNFCMFYSPALTKPESWNFCTTGNTAY